MTRVMATVLSIYIGSKKYVTSGCGLTDFQIFHFSFSFPIFNVFVCFCCVLSRKLICRGIRV